MSSLENSTTFKPFITIVSGLPRSGTSMMMAMLAEGGIPPLTDAIRRADEDNPEGYYELEVVKMLPAGDVGWLGDAQGRSVKIIASLLPHLPGNHQYRVLLMHRNLAEVLASQRQMLIRRGEDPDAVGDEVIGSLFEKHLHEVASWLAGRPEIAVLRVDYNQILVDPWPVLREIDEFLGGELNLEAMAAVINPGLYRQRASGAPSE